MDQTLDESSDEDSTANSSVFETPSIPGEPSQNTGSSRSHAPVLALKGVASDLSRSSVGFVGHRLVLEDFVNISVCAFEDTRLNAEDTETDSWSCYGQSVAGDDALPSSTMRKLDDIAEDEELYPCVSVSSNKAPQQQKKKVESVKKRPLSDENREDDMAVVDEDSGLKDVRCLAGDSDVSQGDVHLREDICDSSHLDHNAGTTSDATCRLDHTAYTTPDATCCFDRTAYNTPNATCRLDRNTDTTPDATCHLDRNTDTTPDAISRLDRNANTTPDENCNKFRKHSSGDLHSRLKTRKLLGVGETDDGDVHRSKLSQILGHSDQLYLRLPNGLRVWLIILSLLISTLAVWALLFPSHYFSTMYDVDGSTFAFPVRLYACALISIAVMYWSTVQASDRDVIRMILLSSVVFFALQTCVLLSCWLPWLPSSQPASVLCSVVLALIARLVVIAISSYFYWITHKDGKSKDVKYFR